MPHVVADTDALQRDGVISAEAAREIAARGREAMVSLAINAVLCFGILAATMGLIFWLAAPLPVAVVGGLFLGGGLLALSRSGASFRMFGNAAALIGAGMLLGGSAFELIDTYPDIAGWVLLVGGAVVMAFAGRALWRGGLTTRFVQGAILLMGLAQHVTGLGWLLYDAEITGLPKALFLLYASGLLAGAGALTDVRLVTAAAIVPFAQALETGTVYFHAAYVFYSPEPTLSILQMILLVAALVTFVNGREERIARHGRVLTVLAFVVANLCALVGSLWGDVVGETLWGPGRGAGDHDTYEAWQQARDAFLETALVVPEGLYAVLWAMALLAIVALAAHRGSRALFNTATTFGGIHAYTQLFESFGDEPLAYVIGGLAAIPFAWAMWRANSHLAPLTDRTKAARV